MNTAVISFKVDRATQKMLEDYSASVNFGKSQIIREALKAFLAKKSPSDSLLKMAEEARKYEYNAPDDAVSNMNKYLYESK